MMTTIGLSGSRSMAATRRLRSGTLGQRLLLAAGIISSLLYVAADVFGSLQYDGYDFTSQAVSELMATGAPSERFVDPLFIASGVLTLAFGVGVFRAAAGRARALRVTGALLIVYAIAGFTGPTLFEMHPRGAGTVADDTPHIVLTAVLVALTLVAIGVGGWAFGRVFRIYSFATLAMMITLGAVSGRYGALLAAGEPTPGFGIIERVLIYSSLLWFSALAIALMRRSSSDEGAAMADAAHRHPSSRPRERLP
jgi:hypothetical protein